MERMQEERQKQKGAERYKENNPRRKTSFTPIFFFFFFPSANFVVVSRRLWIVEVSGAVPLGSIANRFPPSAKLGAARFLPTCIHYLLQSLDKKNMIQAQASRLLWTSPRERRTNESDTLVASIKPHKVHIVLPEPV